MSIDRTRELQSSPGTVNNGNTVTVRQTSSISFSTTTNTTLTIGAVSDTFSLMTLDDTTPNAFTLTDQTGVPLKDSEGIQFDNGGRDHSPRADFDHRG